MQLKYFCFNKRDDGQCYLVIGMMLNVITPVPRYLYMY